MIRFQDVEWRLLSEVIESRFGLVFDAMRKEMLEDRLTERLVALHLETFTEYYHYLVSHPNREKEFSALAENVTNGETYFLRERHHFEILTKHIVPGLMAARGANPLRILSGGCSAGQEAYSIALMLRETCGGPKALQWEIDACDINPIRLSQANEAVYEESSLRACDNDERSRWFNRINGRWAVKPEYRQGIRFFEANLVARNSMMWGVYDVIFCRNVLIYFSDAAFHTAIDRFAQCLSPGGFLILGHSESLINKRTDFEPVCLDNRIVYRLAEDK